MLINKPIFENNQNGQLAELENFDDLVLVLVVMTKPVLRIRVARSNGKEVGTFNRFWTIVIPKG